MENGYHAESVNDGGSDQWENGLDMLPNVSEQLYSALEQSVEQSVEQLPQENYSQEYDMGAFQGYTIQDFGLLYGAGMGAGFAVAVCVALAAWAVACAISILKKGGNVR